MLDELASSINTLNLERVRRLKGHLLALTQQVQKVQTLIYSSFRNMCTCCSFVSYIVIGFRLKFQVRDELEHLMDDDGDMAEMYLTEKKLRSEGNTPSELNALTNFSGGTRLVSKSAPVSPVASTNGAQRLQRAFSSILTSSKQGSLISSSNGGENIEQLEMLLEAYFVAIDHTLSKLFSVRDL